MSLTSYLAAPSRDFNHCAFQRGGGTLHWGMRLRQDLIVKFLISPEKAYSALVS